MKRWIRALKRLYYWSMCDHRNVCEEMVLGPDEAKLRFRFCRVCGRCLWLLSDGDHNVHLRADQLDRLVGIG
ncbi:MAG TPA: hypothetical protein VG370_34790 [Chloroflexota bacterium]|nr:hypothetical protein [Chloroflexota bacterium]